MAVFEYQRWQSPYTNSIAALMERQGEIPAQAAERVGNAQAAGILGAGQAWAGAAQNVGQAVSGAIQQAIDPRRKLETQALEANQLKIDAEKRAVALNGTVNKLVATAMTQQPDGTYTFDRGKLRSGFTASNVPIPLQEQTFKSLDEVDRSLQTFNALKVDHLADLAHATLTNPHGATPEAFAFTAALAKANGLVTDQQLSPIIDAIANGRDVKELLTQVRGLSEKYKDAAKPTFAPRESPGYMQDGTFHPLATPAKPEAGVVFKDAEGVEHPVTFDGKDYLYNSKVVTDKVTRPATKTNYQHVDKLLDGKPATLMLDPSSPDKIFSLDGKPVENAATRVRPMPPAAIQVQNLVSAAQSANPVDASRPDPKTANIPDKLTGLTPNALYQTGIEWALTGKIPSQGLGSSARAQAVRAAIPNKGSALAAAAGVDIPTLQAEYRANSTALNRLLPQAVATANFANTATDNLDLALQASPKVTRTDAAFINSMANAFVRGATPAAALTDFEVKIYTAAREYAKVTSGGALSAQGLTDSAAREASKLLSAAQSPDAFAAAVAAMKQDMGNVISEQTKGLQKVSSTIANFFSVTNGGGSIAATSQRAPAVEHWERGPDGNLRKVGG